MTHTRAVHWPLMLPALILGALSVTMIYSVSAVEGSRQLAYVLAGVVLCVLLCRLPYSSIALWAWPLYGVAAVLLLYTNIPWAPLVPTIKGIRAWIDIGVLRFQPSELAKPALCLVLALYFRYRPQPRTFADYLPPFGLALPLLIMILKQPDLGTALTFFPVLLGVLYLAGAKPRHVLGIILSLSLLGAFAWFSGTDMPVFRSFPKLVKTYQRDRVIAMFSSDPRVMRTTGYQQEQALIALGASGFWGRGLGKVELARRVPEVHTDMIIVLVGEQLGFPGTLGVMLVFLVLFMAMLAVCMSTREPFGRFLTASALLFLVGQTAINLFVATRMMPVTGVTLPFLSFGGSSVFCSFLILGLVMNVAVHRPASLANTSAGHEAGTGF